MAEAGDGINYGNDIIYSTSPDISVTGGQIGDYDAGFEAPMTSFLFPVFGPNLREAAIPEPGTLALVGVGIAGLAGARGRIRRDRR